MSGGSPQLDALRTPARRGLALLIVAWGAQAIITQTVLLREAIVLMSGSEFAWGVVLFAWLLGVAIGAAIGGRVAERLADQGRSTHTALVLVLLLLGVASCADIWFFRGARAWLGVDTGELLPLPKTAFAALLLVTPTSTFVGMAFPLACRVGRTAAADDGGLLSFGQVYTLESVGSLLGGTVFTFWMVEALAPIEAALVCLAVTAAIGTALLAMAANGRRRAVAPAVVAAAAIGMAALAGGRLNRGLVERRWHSIAPGYALVAEAETRYQNLAVGRRAGQFTLYSDGHVVADFPDPYTFVPLAHFWMCQHPSPRRVLVLGGGVEGLLAEILRHPVESVDYVEPDPRVIELVRPLLADADRRALADPRVAVHYTDARYFVKTQRDRFDLVIARLPDPTSALAARLYTDEFFGELRRAMTPKAVLCTMVAAAPGELSAASREYLASMRATLARRFADIIIGWGDPAQVLAATAPALISVEPSVLVGRFKERGIEAPLFDPAWFQGATDWLDPDKVSWRKRDLDAATSPPVSTDLWPIVYLQRLTLWERATSGGLATGPCLRIIEKLRSINLAEVIAAFVAMGLTTLVVYRLRGRSRAGWGDGAVVLSVGTTGLATMALSIIWLFAFQSLYGYVYQRIGWIIALFMGGLVIGCGAAARLAERADASRLQRIRRMLIGVDLLIALLAIGCPLALRGLGSLEAGRAGLVLVEGSISALVVMTGLLGGAAFPLAGRLRLSSTRRPGIAAGSVVGADHAGACVGALVCGILLVPVFGIVTAALLLAGTKAASAIAVGVCFRPT